MCYNMCCAKITQAGMRARGKIYFCLHLLQFNTLRDVAQLVARLLWEQDVAGSNPVIPTIPLQLSRGTFCYMLLLI